LGLPPRRRVRSIARSSQDLEALREDPGRALELARRDSTSPQHRESNRLGPVRPLRRRLATPSHSAGRPHSAIRRPAKAGNRPRLPPVSLLRRPDPRSRQDSGSHFARSKSWSRPSPAHGEVEFNENRVQLKALRSKDPSRAAPSRRILCAADFPDRARRAANRIDSPR
jgi:hypothetical protein